MYVIYIYIYTHIITYTYMHIMVVHCVTRKYHKYIYKYQGYRVTGKMSLQPILQFCRNLNMLYEVQNLGPLSPGRSSNHPTDTGGHCDSQTMQPKDIVVLGNPSFIQGSGEVHQPDQEGEPVEPPAHS